MPRKKRSQKSPKMSSRAAMSVATSNRTPSKARITALAEAPLAVCESDDNLQAVIGVLRNREEPVEVRLAAMDTLAQDYIKAARAKGLPERLVLLRHLVRNAFLPMITLIGLSIPALLAGNLICEAVFNFPGLGLLFYDSLGTADYPVLLAYTLVGAALTIAGNFIADISLTVADPRIRLV